MISINDVARKAGVSKSTVSRVINNKTGVQKETKQKILEAMKELNYFPNSSARTLALKHSKTLGVVVRSMFTHVFYNKYIEAIYDTASKYEYGVLFCVNNVNLNQKIQYSSMLLGKVDGIIFLGHDSVSRKDIVNLNDSDFPMVLIDNNYNVPGTTSINVNNYNGAYNETKYLIECGHKKIAHIMGDVNAFDAIERFNGYKQALKDYELEFDEGLVIEGNYSFETAYYNANRLLDSKRKFTAIFCANDVMAAAFIKSAYEHNINIPEDISVAGFDDVDLSRSLINHNIALTTIRQPRYEIGKLAVETIIQRIEENVVSENKNIEMELIIRESTSKKVINKFIMGDKNNDDAI